MMPLKGDLRKGILIAGGEDRRCELDDPGSQSRNLHLTDKDLSLTCPYTARSTEQFLGAPIPRDPGPGLRIKWWG
jgi:hypothetical protein